MEFNFTGKKFLVTGGSSGIGRGIVIALCKAGADVYALSNVREQLDSLKEEVASIHTVYNDLADWDATRACVEQLETMDGLVNCAAAACPAASVLEHGMESFNTTLPVTMLAPVNVTQVIAKKMIQAGKKGSIVNISSINSERVFPGLLPYSMAKAGLDMMTKHFATELGPFKIRVNSVSPTAVTTKAAAKWREEFGERLDKATPLGRPAEIAEVVAPVLYLLSDASSMVTGTRQLVDGGVFCIGLF